MPNVGLHTHILQIFITVNQQQNDSQPMRLLSLSRIRIITLQLSAKLIWMNLLYFTFRWLIGSACDFCLLRFVFTPIRLPG